jgi:nucleotide-binding universal stress UspA family protein
MATEPKSTANNNNNKNSSIDDQEIQLRKILVPIDGSECSLYAAKHAVNLAKDENAQLFCIHVIGSIPYGYQLDGSAVQEYFENIENQAKSWFDKVRDMVKNEGISEPKTETFSGVESVIESIIDYATNKDVDLIVIGTRGRTGLKRLIMGSVANGVVQHAHCPVLLVR